VVYDFVCIFSSIIVTICIFAVRFCWFIGTFDCILYLFQRHCRIFTKLYRIYTRIYARRSSLKPGYGSWQNHGQHFSNLRSSQKFLILKITVVSRRTDKSIYKLLFYNANEQLLNGTSAQYQSFDTIVTEVLVLMTTQLFIVSGSDGRMSITGYLQKKKVKYCAIFR